MREQDLPILCRDGRHHCAKDNEEAACDGDMAKVSGVGEAAGEGADEEEEEDVEGADPGNVGFGAVEGGDIIALEQTEGGDQAPVRVCQLFSLVKRRI
jgi:hypothetical protein